VSLGDEEIPRCPHEHCGIILLAVPDGGCDEPGFDCPVTTTWPHGIDQSGLPPESRWIRYA
jgi:hypothetical protein